MAEILLKNGASIPTITEEVAVPTKSPTKVPVREPTRTPTRTPVKVPIRDPVRDNYEYTPIDLSSDYGKFCRCLVDIYNF